MNPRPKRSSVPYLLLGIFLVGGLAALDWLVGLDAVNSVPWTSSHKKQDRMTPLPLKSTPFLNSAPPSQSKGTHPSDQAPWSQKVTQLVQKMALTTEDPDGVDREISNLALTLSKEALHSLYQTLLSSTASGDEKLLGVELIARSQLPESKELLKSLIQQDVESVSHSPLIQTEFKAFQLLSIEALGEKSESKASKRQTLVELSRTITDPLLMDRLHRSLWALDGRAPSPKQQDEEALAKLLQKRN